MRRLFSLCMAGFLLILSACGGRGKPAVVHTEAHAVAGTVSPSTITTMRPETPQSGETAPIEISSEDYCLGDELSDKMPFSVRGHLSVPQTGMKLPLILILHGNHGADDTHADFYQGFSYLTEYLARRGYAAASLDIQSAYAAEYGSGDDDAKTLEIVARQVEYFTRANAGEALFPVDLAGRLDMEHIVLVGHSRAGDAALNLACDWESVVGACAVAPNLRVAEKAWRDIPLAILVPQLDGDVDTLDGYAYLWPRWKADLKSTTVLTLLEGGNHNYFNSKLTEDDASVYGGATLTPAEQQEFLCRYLADFCDAVTKAETDAPVEAAWPVFMERYDLSVRELAIAKRMELLTNTEQGAAASEGCNVRRMTVDSRTTDIHIPLSWGTKQTLTFWEGMWSTPKAVMDLPLTAGDLSRYRELALDAGTMEGTENLTLVLTDEKGASAGVRIPEMNLTKAGSEYLVFSQIRIPLIDFKGVDLERIARFSLVADCGGVWISALWGG